MANKVVRDYNKDKEQLKTFFLEFVTINDKEGDKVFKYRQHLTKIAHREQISFEIDLDDVQSFDEYLAKAIANNTKRYTNLVLNLVQDMLPDFKERAILPKDSLDIYMEHRLLMQARNRNQGEAHDNRVQYAPELMRRL